MVKLFYISLKCKLDLAWPKCIKQFLTDKQHVTACDFQYHVTPCHF